MKGRALCVSCIFAMAVIYAAGCHIRGDGWLGDDWEEDCGYAESVSVSAGAGGYIGPGDEGAPCSTSGDCNEGLVCDPVAQYCVTPSPCAANADCSLGCYCDPQTGLCAPSSVCAADPECGDGFTCDEALASCVPGEDPPPACQELASEAACSARSDCRPVYAGVDCSCGAGCECKAGEAGCVCKSFEFFRCEAAL